MALDLQHDHESRVAYPRGAGETIAESAVWVVDCALKQFPEQVEPLADLAAPEPAYDHRFPDAHSQKALRTVAEFVVQVVG